MVRHASSAELNDAFGPDRPPPVITEWVRNGTVSTCHLIKELRAWLEWAERGHEADGCICQPEEAAS